MKKYRIVIIALIVLVGIAIINISAANTTRYSSDSDPQLTLQRDDRLEIYPPEPLKDASGFAYIDAEGKTHEFRSVEEIESWVKGYLDLGENQEVAIFKQRIGRKIGLLVVVGSRDLIPVMVEAVYNPKTVSFPTTEALQPDEIRQASQRSLEITKMGKEITLDGLHELTTEFNKASSVGGDPNLTSALIELMHDLANSR